MQKIIAASCRAVLPGSPDQRTLARHQPQQPSHSTASRLSARSLRAAGRRRRQKPSTANSERARPLSTLPPAAAGPSSAQEVNSSYCEILSV